MRAERIKLSRGIFRAWRCIFVIRISSDVIVVRLMEFNVKVSGAQNVGHKARDEFM